MIEWMRLTIDKQTNNQSIWNNSKCFTISITNIETNRILWWKNKESLQQDGMLQMEEGRQYKYMRSLWLHSVVQEAMW